MSEQVGVGFLIKLQKLLQVAFEKHEFGNISL